MPAPCCSTTWRGHLPSPPSDTILCQVPKYITVTPREDMKGLLPIEVAWWWLFKVGVRSGQWVFLVSAEARLAAELLVRAGVGLNVMWGIPYLDDNTVEALTEPMNDLTGKVKVADGLPPVRWDQECLYASKRVFGVWFLVSRCVQPWSLRIYANSRKGVWHYVLHVSPWRKTAHAWLQRPPAINDVMRDLETHYPVDVTGKPAVINMEDEPEHPEPSQKDSSSAPVCLCSAHSRRHAALPCLSACPLPRSCSHLED